MSLIKKINDPNGKQYDDISIGTLVLDTEPIEGSFNPVTSDAVVKAIDEAKEDMQEKIDEVTLDPSAVALGNVHLLDEVTEFPADGCILVDSETNGPGEMSKDTLLDTLLEPTAQNALAGNVAPAFVPNDTNAVAGMPYVYGGKFYVAKEDYSGEWDASKFKESNFNEYNYEYLRKLASSSSLTIFAPEPQTPITNKFISNINVWESVADASCDVFELEAGRYVVSRLDDSAVFAVVDSTEEMTGHAVDFSEGNLGRIIRAKSESFEFEIKNTAYLLSFEFNSRTQKLAFFKSASSSKIEKEDAVVAGLLNGSNGVTFGNSHSMTVMQVKPGDEFLITPAAGNTAILAFLKTDVVNSEDALDSSAYAPGRIIARETRKFVVPPDANYIAYMTKVSGSVVTPSIEYQRKNTANLSDNVTFVNAALTNNAILYVNSGAQNNDHRTLPSKDLYISLYGYVGYSVTTGYECKFIYLGDDFEDDQDSGFVSGSGNVLVRHRMFRVVVRKSGGTDVIVPSEVSVSITGVEIPYGDGDLILYPYGTTNTNVDKLVAGEDAASAIQILSDTAYANGKKLKLMKGKYLLDSYKVYGSKNLCIVFSNIYSEKQYENTFFARTIEGPIKPCGFDGDDVAIIEMTQDLYDSITSEAVGLIGSSVPGLNFIGEGFFTCCIKLKNLVIRIPNNQKAISAINLNTAEGGSHLESLRIIGIPVDSVFSGADPTFPQIANAYSFGIISNPGSTWNTSTYWRDIEVMGFGVGVSFKAVEHAFVNNLTVQWCTYGMKFEGGNQHPIVLIAVQDEHNVNLPYFGTRGGGITLMGYNASWPEKAPGFPSSDTEGWSERKRATGNPIGRIDFTNNANPQGQLEGNLYYPTFFEKGEGVLCHVTNLNHPQNGTTAVRNTLSPNVGQQYYDTDLGKLLICTDVEPSVWSEA